MGEMEGRMEDSREEVWVWKLQNEIWALSGTKYGVGGVKTNWLFSSYTEYTVVLCLKYLRRIQEKCIISETKEWRTNQSAVSKWFKIYSKLYITGM